MRTIRRSTKNAGKIKTFMVGKLKSNESCIGDTHFIITSELDDLLY